MVEKVKFFMIVEFWSEIVFVRWEKIAGQG